MKESMRNYRKNKKSYAKKKAYDSKFGKKPEQRKKRAKLVKINRDKGTYGNGDKLDASHTKKGIVMKPQSANRGDKDDMKGDKRSRGYKSKRKTKK